MEPVLKFRLRHSEMSGYVTRNDYQSNRDNHLIVRPLQLRLRRSAKKEKEKMEPNVQKSAEVDRNRS